MGRVVVAHGGGNFFSNFMNTFVPLYMHNAEQQRREEADKQLGQLYFDMASKDAYQNVQPYEDYSTNSRLKANVADSNLAAVNAPITTSPDRLADTRSLRFMSMTPEERAQAGITSEQSAQMDNALKAEGPVNVQQANAGVAQTLSPIAQQASVNSQNAEQMLAMAKEKYGTDMFDKMQPYIGKIPSDKLIGIVNNMQAKAQQQADKLALNSAMAVFGRKDASDDEKKQAAVTIATLKPELGKMFQNFFAPKDSKLSIAPDGRVVDMRTGLPVQNTPVYAKPEKEKPAAGTWILQTNPDGSQSRINSITGQVINVSPPKETMIQTPFGPMKNTDLLAKIESVRPKEIVTTDDFGNKVTKKDGNAELYNQLMESLKAHQNKQNPTVNSAGNTPTVTMDMVKESITKQGAEMTKKKLMSAGIPEKEAESWINRAANWN